MLSAGFLFKIFNLLHQCITEFLKNSLTDGGGFGFVGEMVDFAVELRKDSFVILIGGQRYCRIR